jgi:cystathionine beta-synthase
MKYYENILGLIGDTPLVKINNLTKKFGIKAQVFAKMENMNPGYSVKDRIGIAMIDDAEAKGILKPGGTLIEATSGNTGIGMALVAAARGYRCVFVMTDKVSVEKRRFLKALGADVVICSAAAKYGSPEHYVETAKRIARETPNSFYPDQYNHPANPLAHYKTTGPEIWRDTEGKITHFVASIGTGGTISGTSRYLKEMNPNIKVIAGDPYGSIFKTFKETGQVPEATPYLVEGIGQNIVVGNADMKVVDEIINITDRESFEMSRLLSREEGIFCGGSAGTIFAAAMKAAKNLDENAVMVFIVCDTGEHYLSKHHSDEWMKEKLMLEPQKITASLIAETKGADAPKALISIEPNHSVAEALQVMSENGITQLPVIENEVSVGAVRENGLLGKLIENKDLMTSPVSAVMESPFPVVEVDSPFDEMRGLLKKSPAILVKDFNRITSIITRSDLLETIAAEN